MKTNIPTRFLPLGAGEITPPPPYDALCEYVANTGSQYVDTGIVPGPQTEIRMQATATQTAGRGMIYTYPQSENSELRIFFNLSGTTFYYDRGSARLQYSTSARYVDLVATNYALYLSGTLVMSGNQQPWTGTTSLRVFGTMVNGGKYDLMQLRTLAILDGSTLLRDFAPCRVGSAGALYDRVSGSLFYSATSTALIPGPDLP